MRLLAQHPWLARHDINTAVVCGEIDHVRHLIAHDARVAVTPSSTPSPYRGMSGGANDLYGYLGAKGWSPLSYLAFARLPLDATNDHAVDVARLLLDAGADPNVFFDAGDSHYTPMTGVAGEGEEDRPPHPRREELTRLLLEFDANPYDIQVVYNLGFHSEYLWWLPLIYERSVVRGRIADWQDPEWRMLDMGGYGCGARWLLDHAIEHDKTDLAAWCLAHGASANAPPGRSAYNTKGSLYEEAVQARRTDIAELLLRHGATRVLITPRDEPPYAALHRAANENRPDEIHRLLDAGVSPDVADDQNMRALHAAAYANAPDAARALVERGAEIDPVEKRYGGTPLGGAAHYLNRAVMDVLAPLSRDVWNLTYNGYFDRLREVLAEDPTRARVDWGEWSPLLWLPPHDEDVALETAKLFVGLGADAARRATNGATPLSRAEALGMRRLAEYLRGVAG